MSVPKSERRESKFEVYSKMYTLRKNMTDLLLRDFGYKESKAIKGIERRFGGKSYDQLSDVDKQNYDATLEKHKSFIKWFIPQERLAIINYLRNANAEIHAANSIMPEYWSELEKRRLHQDEAIGYLINLEQELQYVIETLPVDVNVYTRFSDQIQEEIRSIKNWRKGDNGRFKAKLIENEKGKGENSLSAIQIFEHFLSYLKT